MLLERSMPARLASANTLLGGHMPGLMGRASTIIKAKFSALLNRAEDPAETLDYSYEEQLRQLQNVKRGIADVTTAKKRLELQDTPMQQQVEKHDGQARDVGLAVQRAKDKTEQLQARAAAVDELTTSGALEDFTSSDDDIDRQLKQISQSGQVDDELAKMKAELGTGAAEAPKEISS